MPYDAVRPDLPQALDRVSAPAVRTIGPRSPKLNLGGGRMILIPKTASENRVSTTVLAGDGELFLNLVVGDKVSFRFRAFISTFATPDFKYQIGFPAGADIWTVNKELPSSATAFNAFVDTNPAVHALLGAASQAYLEIEGRINNTANPGTLILNWAQNTSDPGTTAVLLGSSLEYWKF